MGYETSLHLIDVKIKAESLPLVKRALKDRKSRGGSRLQDFLERAVLDSAGFLAFKASADGGDKVKVFGGGSWARYANREPAGLFQLRSSISDGVE